MPFRIGRVEASGLPVMYALLVICGEHMHRTLGLAHWHPFRPYDVYLAQIDPTRVYAIYADDVLAGTFALNPVPRPYYTPQMWTQPDAPALYFGLFGVLPAFQRQGVGAWAMQQVDALTQADGFAAVRFDAVAQHPRLLAFYDRLGYARRGVVTLTPQMRELMCYERVFEME